MLFYDFHNGINNLLKMNDFELKIYGELLSQAVDCLQSDKNTKKRINAQFRLHSMLMKEQKRKEIDARKARKIATKKAQISA